MLLVDEQLFQRIRTEYLASDFNWLIKKYSESNRSTLQKILGSHDYEEFKKRINED